MMAMNRPYPGAGFAPPDDAAPVAVEATGPEQPVPAPWTGVPLDAKGRPKAVWIGSLTTGASNPSANTRDGGGKAAFDIPETDLSALLVLIATMKEATLRISVERLD